MNIGPVDYASDTTPEGYRCGTCGAHGCKLWRRVGVYQAPVCAECCVGETVPAIPTEDGASFWGLFCINGPGMEWWKRLPCTPSPTCPEGGDPESWGLYVTDVGPIVASAPHVTFGIEVGEEP